MAQIIRLVGHSPAEETSMSRDVLEQSGFVRNIANIAIVFLAILTLSPSVLPQQSQPSKNSATQTKRKERKKVGLFSGLKTTIDVGGRFRSLKGDKPGKFEEDSEVPK